MATIKVGNAMPEYGWFEDFYDEGSLKLVTKKSGIAIYEDHDGSQIVLHGNGFSYNGSRITGGTIKGVDFLDEHGGTLIAVTGGKFDADKTTDALENTPNLWDFMTALTAGNDRIYGSNVGSDLNFGENHGNDLIVAGKGGASIAGSEGNDTMKGGAGWDSITFADTFWRSDDKHGIALDAAKGTILDSWGDKDKFDNKFEQFEGSVYSDVMKGSKRDESFRGLKGDDVIDGGGGYDEVQYHRDAHYHGNHGIVANLLTGKIKDGFGDVDHVKNIEAVFGTYKNDKFIGDNHDDRFRGLSGVDTFDGGKGTDQVDFDWWEDLGQHGVKADLSRNKNQIIDDGFGNTETTKSIEALSGSTFDDVLKLGKSNGWVWANDGDDTLIAGIGSQWFGGAGGADTFQFDTVAALKGKDFIDDFSHAEGDVIDLSGVGGLVFQGTDHFSGTAGELYYVAGKETKVFGDIDGDKKADFELIIGDRVNLVGSDFIL